MREPYREMERAEGVIGPRRSRLLHAVCLLVGVATLGWRGHRWKIVNTNVHKAISLAHMHPLAGSDAVCLRCGLTWLDAEYMFERREREEFQVALTDLHRAPGDPSREDYGIAIVPMDPDDV